MKKTIVALLGLFLIASCSSDSDSANVAGKTLLKKAIISHDGGPEVTADYVFDADTLRKITYSDGGVDNYSYKDGNLWSIQEFRDGNPYRTFEYVYTGNILPAGIIETVHTTGKVTAAQFVNHSSDDIYVYYYDVNSLGTASLIKASSLTFNRDNLVSNEIYNTSFVLLETHNYTFDAKNNPLRNMFANKVMVITRLDGGENNCTKIARTGAGAYWEVTSSYTYNDNNFPVTATRTDKDGSVTNIQYFYE